MTSKNLTFPCTKHCRKWCVCSTAGVRTRLSKLFAMPTRSLPWPNNASVSWCAPCYCTHIPRHRLRASLICILIQNDAGISAEGKNGAVAALLYDGVAIEDLSLDFTCPGCGDLQMSFAENCGHWIECSAQPSRAAVLASS